MPNGCASRDIGTAAPCAWEIGLCLALKETAAP